MENEKNLKFISLVSLITALIIMVVFNIKVKDSYNLIVNIPIFLLLISYIIIIRKMKLDKNNKAYYYLIPIGLIMASNYIIKIDITNALLNLIVLPILISIFFFSLTNTNYKLSKESFNWVFKFFPGGLFNNFKYFKFPLKIDNKKKNIINILLGVVIGLVIGGVILTLLVSADKYFSEFMSGALSIFNKVLNFRVIRENIIVLVVSFIILFCTFINILKNRKLKMKEGRIYNINTSLGITILTIVNLIFILFLISEISKLTVNFLNIPIEYTYAQYVREGFFQLLGVTSINFILIIYFLYYTNKIKESNFIKILLLMLIGFSIILIFNAYYRMFLYVAEYGFTILRSQVILFLTMELILFVLLVTRIVRDLKQKDAYIYYTVLITTYILNLYLCSEPFVNQLNKITKIVGH